MQMKVWYTNGRSRAKSKITKNGMGRVSTGAIYRVQCIVQRKTIQNVKKRQAFKLEYVYEGRKTYGEIENVIRERERFRRECAAEDPVDDEKKRGP